MRKRHTPEPIDPIIQQRIEDCDYYHMHFDGAARDFRDHVDQTLVEGGAVAFEETFRDLEDSTRERLLREMYADLDPQGKLTLVAGLMGDTATQGFLRSLVETQSNYDKAMLTIRAEALASLVLRPSFIPRGAELQVYLSTRDRVAELPEDADLAGMDYDRSLALRSLGDGTFKVIDEGLGADLAFVEGEYFGVNHIVRVGAAVCGKGGRRAREKVIRLEEMLAVSRDSKTAFLRVRPAYPEANSDDVVVTCVEIDGEQILPPLAPST